MLRSRLRGASIIEVEPPLNELAALSTACLIFSFDKYRLVAPVERVLDNADGLREIGRLVRNTI